MEMIELTLYLQRNYCGTFSLAEAVDYETWGYNYSEICEFDRATRYADVVEYAKSIGCKKLVIDF